MTDRGQVENAEPTQVITVVVTAPLCRPCVRLLSRRVSDVPGVVSLEVDATDGRLRILGAVDVQQVLAVLRSAGFAPVPVVDP